MRRMGEPDDIANVVLSLTRATAELMTGEVIIVDGDSPFREVVPLQTRIGPHLLERAIGHSTSLMWDAADTTR